MYVWFFVFKEYGDHRELHVLTHSFPTRRSAGLEADVCVLATALDAVDLGYRVVIASDAVTSSSAVGHRGAIDMLLARFDRQVDRSEEHTSELQSLMRLSYAVFCLKKKKTPIIVSVTQQISLPIGNKD